MIIALCGSGGALLIREVWVGISGWRDGGRTHDRLSRQDTRAEFQELFDRLNAEVSELQARAEEVDKERRAEAIESRKREDLCREELNRVWRKFDRQTTWMEYLQDVLTKAGIAFRPWLDPDTAEHKPLTTG